MKRKWHKTIKNAYQMYFCLLLLICLFSLNLFRETKKDKVKRKLHNGKLRNIWFWVRRTFICLVKRKWHKTIIQKETPRDGWPEKSCPSVLVLLHLCRTRKRVFDDSNKTTFAQQCFRQNGDSRNRVVWASRSLVLYQLYFVRRERCTRHYTFSECCLRYSRRARYAVTHRD